MIAPAPMCEPAKTIAPAHTAAPSSMTRASSSVRGAPEVGARRGGLPSTALSWTTTPSPMTTPSWTTTLAPKLTSRPTEAVGLRTRPGAGGSGMAGYPSDAVPSPDSTRPLRGAVLGLGMIGRHHARLLQASPRVSFAGAVDPAGDRFGSVRDEALLFPDLGALLSAGTPDFAIVAVPTEEHVSAVGTLAAEGVNVLVEKPLAATAAEGRVLIDVCRAAG